MNKIALTSTLIPLFGIVAIPICRIEHAHAQTQQQVIPFVVQNTTKFMQDPLPGHETHQVVIAALPRDDGRIYSGLASITSSQPVEVVLLHMYKSALNSTFTQEPLNASFDDGKFAASLIKQFTDAPFNAASFVFAGNALAFHNLEGKPFVITYAINGEIASLTQ
jgi:hypothetical protein